MPHSSLHRAVAAAVLVLTAGSSTHPMLSLRVRPAAASTDDDPYPVCSPDGCSYWKTRCVLPFFQPGNTVPLGRHRADALLDHIPDGWREGHGFLPVERHLGASKAALQPLTAELRCADAVRDGLMARGIPAALIRLKPLGASEPPVPGATAEQGG
ncbi:MAG: hypothetical protein ACRYG8_44960 [Janthinobacterium lividum]